MSNWRLRLDRWSAAALERPAPLFWFAAVLLLVQIGPWWYSVNDSACYLSMGRTWWSDEGPTSLGDRYKAYAVGYSILISPLFWLAERPFVWIGVLHFALAALMAVGIYRWALAYGKRAAAFAVAFTLLHACFGLYFRRPLSEMAYMASLYWTVAVLDRVRTATTDGERRAYAVGGTLMLLVTLNMRHNGLLVAPGFAAAMCFEAWRRGTGLGRALLYSAAVVGVAGAVFFTERLLDDRLVVEGRNMTHWEYMATKETSKFGQLMEGVKIQMLDFFRVIVPGALKTHAKSRSWLTFPALLALAATVPVVYGWWLLVRRRADVLLLTIPFFLLLNFAYSNDQGARYTLPILPVVALALWTLLERIRIEPSRVLMPLLAVHVLAGIGYWTAVDLPRMRGFDARWPDLDALVARIDDDRDRVAAYELSVFDCDRMKLSLDRVVFNMNDEPARRLADMRWLIAATDVPVPEGFRQVAARGPYQLLESAQRPESAEFGSSAVAERGVGPATPRIVK